MVLVFGIFKSFRNNQYSWSFLSLKLLTGIYLIAVFHCSVSFLLLFLPSHLLFFRSMFSLSFFVSFLFFFLSPLPFFFFFFVLFFAFFFLFLFFVRVAPLCRYAPFPFFVSVDYTLLAWYALSSFLILSSHMGVVPITLLHPSSILLTLQLLTEAFAL